MAGVRSCQELYGNGGSFATDSAIQWGNMSCGPNKEIVLDMGGSKSALGQFAVYHSALQKDAHAPPKCSLPDGSVVSPTYVKDKGQYTFLGCAPKS